MRRFSIAAIIPLSLVALSLWALAGKAADFPNLVVIMMDDLADSTYDAAAALDYVPNIEALRARSHEFPTHITPTPLCCPARVNFLTGQLAQTTGVWNNNLGHLMETSGTIASLLQDSGYETAIIGKYLNRVGNNSSSDPFHQPTYIAPGWDHWQVLQKNIQSMYNFNLNENGSITSYTEDYQTDLFSSRAVTLLGEMAEPFFLYVSPAAVHGETNIKALECNGGVEIDWEIRPAPRHENTPFVAAPRPPSYNEGDISDKPWGQKVSKLKRSERECIDNLFSSRVAALRALDDLVGAVVAATPADSVILLISDQGYVFGEHRLVKKGVPYEESIRTRAYLALPAETTKTTHDALVAMIDWAPTLLELAGQTVPMGMEGLPLTCILDGTCQHVRSRVSLYQDFQNSGEGLNPSFTGWRTGPNDSVRPDSVWWSWLPSGLREGYDIQADPYQLNNTR